MGLYSNIFSTSLCTTALTAFSAGNAFSSYYYDFVVLVIFSWIFETYHVIHLVVLPKLKEGNHWFRGHWERGPFLYMLVLEAAWNRLYFLLFIQFLCNCLTSCLEMWLNVKSNSKLHLFYIHNHSKVQFNHPQLIHQSIQEVKLSGKQKPLTQGMLMSLENTNVMF